MFPIGAIVKYSDQALSRLRQDSMGGFSERSRQSARDALARKQAERGTVTGVTQNPGVTLNTYGYTVRWESGVTSQTLDYLLTAAD